MSGCVAARLAHQFWELGAVGSNPITPTMKLLNISNFEVYALVIAEIGNARRDSPINLKILISFRVSDLHSYNP